MIKNNNNYRASIINSAVNLGKSPIRLILVSVLIPLNPAAVPTAPNVDPGVSTFEPAE